MKCTQSISIEQKYGKYLFDKKIKTKKILSKQLPIKTTEEINLNEKNFKSKIKEDIDEKKKFIQIIQSFEDPLSPDNITLENLSFISDIKTSDSQFTIQLKEELPKIRHESLKSGFIGNAFLNPDNIQDIKNDINIIDFKKNYFIEPLLNETKFTKSIKIIKTDILETIDKSIDEINNKEEKNEKKENNNINEKKDDEEEELNIKKRNIIIKSLIYFNRDSIANGIENFKKRIPDLNKSKFEDDNKFEKNIYLRIEDRIREILNKYKCDKLPQLREFENNYIVRIINFQKKSINYKYICIKGIIIGLSNIINDLIGKEYLKSSEEKNDYENDEFILEIVEKYEILKKICIYLEKDFILFIDEFKEEYKLEFKLINIFSDLYWDYVFRIKEINIYFTNNYNNEKISKKVYESIDNVINILININLPYKKLIGELLNISCIKQENIYLMDYIIKYKKKLNKDNDINNNIDNILEKYENKLHNSSSCDKILDNRAINNQKEENTEENNINKEENNESTNNISEETNNNDSNNINNSNNNIINDDKNIDLSLGNSLSMDNCNNKLSDKDSIDKVYNYILYGDNDSDKKKQRKKHKKRKKHKNSCNIIQEEKEEDIIDPVVEEYKNYINNLNKNRHDIKKIRPKFNEEWINYISTYIKE